MRVKIACATDDEKELSRDHFGSAKVYLIYELDFETGQTSFLERIENTTEEERGHGDPIKAKGVSELMKGIHVLVGLTMGPNIARIRKNFVPVISRKKDIKETLKRLNKKLANIKSERAKATGEDRSSIIIE